MQDRNSFTESDRDFPGGAMIFWSFRRRDDFANDLNSVEIRDMECRPVEIRLQFVVVPQANSAAARLVRLDPRI